MTRPTSYRLLRPILLCLLALLAAPLDAQSATAPPGPVVLAEPIVTRHHGSFNGRSVAYTARVEPLMVSGADGRPAARLVTISYVADAPARPAGRPVLFIFNGGPIAPSTMLHMGAFGPRRVAVPDDLKSDPAKFRLVDNNYTLLDVADLVFFDPAGTGFSRIADGVDPASQFSNIADSRQLAQLVLEWCRANGRMESPKYLIGESYGTLRAPEAARQLASEGASLEGIVLLGQAVNIVEYSQRPLNLISYVVSLPTLAATAWELGKGETRGRSFDRFVNDARNFAAGEYLGLLFLGDTAPAARREAAARRLQEFTGLSADWYLAHALRITKTDYQRMLIPGSRLATNDSRYVGPADGPDPMAGLFQAYQDRFAEYLRDDLKAGGIGDYSQLSPFTGGLNGWDWGPNKSPFGDWPYGRAISDLMTANPHFRILVANGWTDTQTTVGAMDYLVSQSGWPRDRVRTATYRGGHMAYTIEASLKRLTDDVRAMVTGKW
ncbi:MAG: peptidase serine carboxypeptidase [Alphaproteobacteria bacterium]|nr:peptidase serine carboxypeptidase [Alphaproteobacteria bacterium]